MRGGYSVLLPGTAHEQLTLDAVGELEICQRKRGYRFGVEASLLAAFVGEKRFRRAVELGTGVGVVSLLVTTLRDKGCIDGVEIQAGLANLARRNVVRNGRSDRIRVVEGDVRCLAGILPENAYDLAFGNPPFRRLGSGRVSPDTERELARREKLLPLHRWLDAAAMLLRNRGRCCFVHDAQRISDALVLLRERGLEPKRLRFVHHTPTHGASLFLLESVKAGRPGMVVEAPTFLE